ncbi:HET-domain-containing protein [Periconia macrospinosa]|uniref:HET-domain-containing protein n=1 Tax=Periconia macrospinosa TaxID=97972 RepID=A0A2V1DUH0_9PLEO|nr:HET-domain-containing protein [Periconia macrospinosa]
MVVCKSCASIDLEKATTSPVARVDDIVASAEKGCQGCIFWIDAFQLAEVYLKELEDDGAWVVLKRYSLKDNFISLYIVRVTDEEKDNLKGVDWSHQKSENISVGLRLCSVNGVERALTHDVVAEMDELPGRLISAHAEYDECYDLAKSWLERCSRTHGPACALKENVFLPTRLIYVPKREDRPLRLLETDGMTGQYVTLSYVWGRGNIFKTTRDNIEARKKGFWPKDLPMSVRDAVKITRRMGFEYIWVDALCIIQGDIDDWARESVLMARVYGDSVFTIQADVARDTDDGILQPRRLIRSHSFGPYESLCLQELEQSWADSITQGYIYGRGWALQERVLAVRVLHFIRDQIIWECNTTIYREGYHGRETDTDAHFGKFGFTKELHQHPTTVGTPEILSQMYVWNSMVQELAIRQFTIPSDRLPGISGIVAAVAIPELGDCFAGVWEWNPFLSMGWHCYWSQPQPSVYRAPSWSWVWTRYQLNWYPETWAYRGPEIEAEWALWDGKWGPRLIDRDIRLASANPCGNVLKGTSITVTGHCRKIFLENIKSSRYDWQGFFVNIDEESEKGTIVHQDFKPEYESMRACFQKEGSHTVKWDDEGAVLEYICLQILRERKRSDYNPKVIGLILTEAEEQGAFRRVGIVAFDFEEEAGWERRSLKLV